SSSGFESGVPPYDPHHSNSPLFLTEQMNKINASFWPFFMRSCVSMRLIRASGPVPIKIGRYTGKSFVCAEGTSVTCDQARTTNDKTASSENAKRRMGKYAS